MTDSSKKPDKLSDALGGIESKAAFDLKNNFYAAAEGIEGIVEILARWQDDPEIKRELEIWKQVDALIHQSKLGHVL